MADNDVPRQSSETSPSPCSAPTTPSSRSVSLGRVMNDHMSTQPDLFSSPSTPETPIAAVATVSTCIAGDYSDSSDDDDVIVSNPPPVFDNEVETGSVCVSASSDTHQKRKQPVSGSEGADRKRKNVDASQKTPYSGNRAAMRAEGYIDALKKHASRSAGIRIRTRREYAKEIDGAQAREGERKAKAGRGLGGEETGSRGSNGGKKSEAR